LQKREGLKPSEASRGIVPSNVPETAVAYAGELIDEAEKFKKQR
jgi:hypothetical protein